MIKSVMKVGIVLKQCDMKWKSLDSQCNSGFRKNLFGIFRYVHTNRAPFVMCIFNVHWAKTIKMSYFISSGV